MVNPEARNQGSRLIFRSYGGRCGNASHLSDAFGYVKRLRTSEGSNSAESHCEEKRMKPIGVTSSSPGAHEKEGGTSLCNRTKNQYRCSSLKS